MTAIEGKQLAVPADFFKYSYNAKPLNVFSKPSTDNKQKNICTISR